MLSFPPPRRLARHVAVAVAGAGVVASAGLPGLVSRAEGLPHSMPAHEHLNTIHAPALGYVPSPVIGRLQFKAGAGHSIQTALANQPIRLSDGTMSPSDTTYVKFRELDLQDLKVTVPGNNPILQVTNNPGTPNVIVGGKDVEVEGWVVFKQIKPCITPRDLHTMVTTYAGVFGGRLDEVLALVAAALKPLKDGALGPVGPCINVAQLVPIVAVALQAGVPVPETVPIYNVDADLYAVKITADPGVRTAHIPSMTAKVVR